LRGCSPNEKEVFASCSVDQTIKIWDARRRERAVLSVRAHDSDVNVISWNPSAPHLLLSGADDGIFRVWDLRNFKSSAALLHSSSHFFSTQQRKKMARRHLTPFSWPFLPFPSFLPSRGVPAASFKWHTGAITSLKWHPQEESVLAVAGADDQISIWDLSLENVPINPSFPFRKNSRTASFLMGP
jgi:ribosome assembly protein RRB1